MYVGFHSKKQKVYQDTKRERKLQKEGKILITFWNNEIYNNLDSCLPVLTKVYQDKQEDNSIEDEMDDEEIIGYPTEWEDVKKEMNLIDFDELEDEEIEPYPTTWEEAKKDMPYSRFAEENRLSKETDKPDDKEAP